MVKLNKLVLLKAKKLIKNEEHQTHVQYKDLTCIVQFINDKQEGHVRLFPHKYVFKININLYAKLNQLLIYVLVPYVLELEIHRFHHGNSLA